MKKISKLIAIFMSVLMVFFMLPVSAFAVNSEVESISVEMTTTLTENADGYLDYEYNEETDDWDLEYYHYYYANYTNITVNYKNGTSISGNDSEIYDLTDEWVSFTDNQSYANQWGIGTHTATAEFMGITADFEVKIIENPVKSISAEMTTTLTENIDGYTDYDYNELTDDWDLKYFVYEYSDYLDITVNYKDGTSISGNWSDISESTDQWFGFSDDQSYENQWGIGTHTATVEFMGITTEFEVEIIENPVESISAEMTTTLTENVDGYWDYWYNEETDDWDLEYFLYDYSDYVDITVNYKDGTSISGSCTEISEITEEWFGFSDDQSYENQWGIGTHTATAEFMGITADFEVEVVKEDDAEANIIRLSGTSRYETAFAISDEGWESADTVVLANGTNFADALVGVPLASSLDAPIILTAGKTLESNVLAQIEKLNPTNIVILGGTGSISSDIENQLSESYTVERIAGTSRYDTATLISKALDPAPLKAIVVTGTNYADALSISPYASLMGYPIVYSNPNTGLTADTIEYLSSADEILIIGGKLSVTEVTENQLSGKTVERIAGTSRYLTSYEIVKAFDSEFGSDVMLATGASFPDALAGGVLAAKLGTPLLLTDPSGLIDEMKDYITSKNPANIYILGGHFSVPDSVIEGIF